MADVPKYRRDLRDKDFEVTPEERATHMHILAAAIPVKRGLEELLSQLRIHDALDQDEAMQVQQTIDLIGGLLYPVALMNVVEDKREKALRSMFSRHLSTSAEVETPDEETPDEETATLRT